MGAPLKSGREQVWYTRSKQSELNGEQVKGQGVKLTCFGEARAAKKGVYDDRVEYDE